MGRRTLTQRAGKGGHPFKSTNHATAKTKYPLQTQETINAQITQLCTDPARTGILAKITLENGKTEHIIAGEGMHEGQKIQIGKTEPELGNITQIQNLTEGTPIYNIEETPQDGGKSIRTSGGYGLIITKDKKKVYVKLKSGKTKEYHPECRATIGLAAGGGRTEKPFIQAGKKHYSMKAKRKKYPKVRGVAMNAIDHPFGGSHHHAGKSKSTKRGAPPGRKVGAIASKRTGRRKKN
jgi:large subunit ribosomal protein L2